MDRNWHPQSWQIFSSLQQPQYQDQGQLESCLKHLTELPPLVHPGEVQSLRRQLAEAAQGRRFVLQAGDCAERFVDCNPNEITNKLKIILQMSLMILYGLRKPLIRIGRIAGQYAKPRSDSTEVQNGVTLPSFRGDIINGFAFDAQARTHDPNRLLEAHRYSAYTINFLRALIEGGFTDVRHPELWELPHISAENQPNLFKEVSKRMRTATEFMEMVAGADSFLRRVDFFTSHEALLLQYESCLTRSVPRYGFVNCGAHFLWLGERTRQVDGAHVEYLRGIQNPIGIKVGPKASAEEIVELTKILDPENEWGKITLITRLGAGQPQSVLPGLVETVQKAGRRVLWSCDPMHGNAVKTQGGVKTRSFDAIFSELSDTKRIHSQMGSYLGGVHFELTGDNVTECLGGTIDLQEHHLSSNYQSYCDPRLNYAQSMEIAYLMSETWT